VPVCPSDHDPDAGHNAGDRRTDVLLGRAVDRAPGRDGATQAPTSPGAPGRLTARDNSVRKTVIALVVIGLVWIGYMAWPLYELTALVRAIDARDVSTVARYVNFDRVRASLTEQIASVYMRRSGIQPGPLAQQAVVVGL
jgi:predicted secreted protein